MLVSRVKLLTICAIPAAGVLLTRIAFSGFEAPTATVKAIEDFRADSKRILTQRIPLLKVEFELTQDLRRKLIDALALGNHLRETGDFRAALQYLLVAKSLAKSDDPLMPNIQFALGQNYLALANAKAAINPLQLALASARNQDLVIDCSELLISAYNALGDYNNLLSLFERMRKKLGIGKISHPTLKLVALAFEKTKRSEDEFGVLEALAEQYPLSPEAIWGFNRLVDFNCMNAGTRKYLFSQKMLQKMSMNRNLDASITQFLIGQTYLPLRLNSGGTRELEKLERLNLLVDLNLTDEAASHLNEIDETIQNASHPDRLTAINLRAKIHYEQKQYDQAAQYFSMLLAQKIEGRERVKALEALASSQLLMGAFGAAAELFKKLVNEHNLVAYSWEHFWCLYRDHKLPEALALLDTNGYVRLKDAHEPLARNYWRARILDQLGRAKDADSEYQFILQQDATSYYANLTLSQRPELWEALTRTPIQRVDTLRDQVRYASLSLEYMPQSPSRDDSVTILHDLVAAGLYRDAMNHLETLKTSSITDDKERSSIGSLAYHLADYRSYRRIALEGFSEFQRFPKNLTELFDHIRQFKGKWEAVFPLAYNDILGRIEEIYGIDRLLLLSLMRTESRYDIFARSPVGARGLLQIMPKTALKISELIVYPNFKVDELFDPGVNIGYAGFYINRLNQYYKQNTMIAIAAYNAGPIAMNRWLRNCAKCTTDELVESITFRETRRYVKEVVKYYGIYSKIYKQQQPFWSIPPLPVALNEKEDLF